MEKDLLPWQGPSGFCKMLTAVLSKSTGDRNVTVRAIGSNISISVRASPEIILSAVFIPLIDNCPRWEVKKHGWHHIHFTHHGLQTIQFKYHNGQTNNRSSKTRRGSRIKKVAA